MNAEDETAKIWKMAEDIDICMLASHEGQQIRSRPMAAQVDRENNRFLFLTDRDSHKDEEIAANPNVALMFSEPKQQDYASISGVAEISNDRELVRALWSTPAKAWWDDPEDPSIRVLIVTPHDGQFWNGPGTAVSMVKMLSAAFSDSRPDLGENKKVSMEP